MTGARRLAAVPTPERSRAVAYIRVSAIAGRDAEHFHSPDLQHRAVADMLGRRGLVEVARVEDIDRTGRDFNREGIRQVIEMARAGQVDVVALYDLSRLGRNTGESLRVINELRDLGVTVISTVEQIDDTPEGQFMLGQFLGMAQLYSDQMGRKWRQVHEHMALDGRQVGQPPIGYRQADTGRVTARGRQVHAGPHETDPILGPAVAQAFRDYAAGARVRDIARRLGDLRGSPMWPAQVRAMLRRRYYLGFVTYKGVESQGQHEPLVDLVTWKAVQRRISHDAKTPPRRLQAAHSLSGLAVCDVCDAKAQLRSTREGASGRVERLGCPRQSDLRACAGCGAMRVGDVEAVVLDYLRTYIRELKVNSDTQAAHRNRAAVAKASAAHLRAELKRNRGEQANLVLERSIIVRELGTQAFTDAAARLKEAEAGLASALAEAETQEGLPPSKAASAIAELLELWPDTNPGQRNRMLRAVVQEVRLRPASYYRQAAVERVSVAPL